MESLQPLLADSPSFEGHQCSETLFFLSLALSRTLVMSTEMHTYSHRTDTTSQNSQSPSWPHSLSRHKCYVKNNVKTVIMICDKTVKMIQDCCQS
uniref:Uncharacterized protein n=1 Tax=Anguilla anguilla TaxID=7936 RepID=A0A0E9W041_ANGAN